MKLSLDTKYLLEEGTVLLTGIQALVRLPLDQHRADRRRGLSTATLVSGYRGSPLGGLDRELQRNPRLLEQHHVRFLPGVNEDLGATAVFGSQMAGLFPRPRYDGVLGMWYGKAPGVDRTGDVFKHANFAGVPRTGGVLAVAGDDATAKSSTLPSQSEPAFYDALMPVLTPGSIQEVLDLGRVGFELSRYAGLWVGFKMATEIADGVGTAEVAPDRVPIVDPGFELGGKPWHPTQSVFLAAPVSLELERELHQGRLEAAKAFARANGLNRIEVSTPRDRIGLAAPGSVYYELREALDRFRLDDAELRKHGIRLLKVRMPFPLEPDTVREFARGLEEIVVVEEKRPFVELFLRDALYPEPSRPRIVGKRDEQGRALVPAAGALDADAIAEILARRLEPHVPRERLAGRLAVLGFLRERTEAPLSTARLFHFCSGCPHNRSTTLPEGSFAGAGIGCHSMAMMMERQTIGISHMGGEGIQWVGASAFTETPHLFQNLGDGTLFHSASLAIRQAVASGANITFKILYNRAVAMTGGQAVDGAMPIPELTRALAAEGIRHIVVVSNRPAELELAHGLARGVEVRPREQLDEVQQRLSKTPGTTVLIYDQDCAAELRRKRRRSEAETPPERIFINEAVCEGCGDCGEKSSCLSLFPVETELGRKTRIHQSSCNQDFSCIDGDCPSFLEVVPRNGKRPALLPFEDVALPRPRSSPKQAQIYLMGIGGTGVVTANQILATAALLEDKRVSGLDQTGLSQKGGPVVSHLRIFTNGPDRSNRIGGGEADLYLAFDILTAAAPAHLGRARPDKTVAVVSTSRIPTGRMVSDVREPFPELDALASRIDAHTRFEDNVYLDASALAEHFFSDHMPANMIVLGAAYQQGLLPLEKWSIEEAVSLNKVAVETNLKAFRLGRRAVAEPEWLRSIDLSQKSPLDRPASLSPETAALIEDTGATGELRRLLEYRARELVAYQDVTYARRYLDFVTRVRKAEAALTPDQTQLSETVARALHRLMAYKDEYEVARLHTRPELDEALERQFGEGARYRYLLQPPLLRAVGLRRKLALGPWFRPALRALAKLKLLRGSSFDPFGYTKMRRTERALIEEYRTLIEGELSRLTSERYPVAVELAGLPEEIRGYEEIKLRSIERFRQRARELGSPSQ